MQNILKNIPESVKEAVKTTLPLVIVLILFLTVGKFGLAKVSEIRGKISQGEKDVATLTQKLNLLQALSVTAAEGSQLALAAVPDANPALAVISQLRNLAQNQGVIISGIKSNTGPTTNGLSEAGITFTVDGVRNQVFTFLVSTQNTAPLLFLDKIKISETGGALRADVSVKSFWAALPKSIPAVGSVITDLSANEKQMLTKAEGLIKPILTGLTPTTGAESINPLPFGQ